MNIKKSIVGSLFSMLLVSEMAAADWGDVYYCQMINLVKMDLDGTMTRYNSQKFQFKLDQTKNAMVFGSTGFFKDAVKELVKGANFPNTEFWYAKHKSDTNETTFFENGKFLHTRNGSEGAYVISADCEKF